MQVTNITVGYDRKRQPAQYESAGATVQFSAVLSATVGDTEDHMAVATKLLGDAKTIVLTELGLVKAGESASAVVRAAETPAAAEAPKPEGSATSPKRTTAKKTADAPKPEAAKAPAASAAEEIPGEEGSKPNGAGAPSSAADDIPGEDSKPAAAAEAPKPEAAKAETSTADIHAYVSKLITDGKIDKPTVKGIGRKFGVERIADLKPEKLGEYKAALDEAVKAFGQNGDL